MRKNVTLLVLGNPAARYLRHLAELPDSVRIVTGERTEMFEQAAGEAVAVLNCFQPRETLEWVLANAPKLEWIHSLAVGLDTQLFPALVESPVPLTNSRGVFSDSLGEFATLAILYFAKDLPRMLANQAASRWEQYDVEVAEGKTLGIVGLGTIGRACARRARALGMRTIALKKGDEPEEALASVDEAFPRDALHAMLGRCDYVVASMPLTPETRGLLGEAEFRAMKPRGVVINIGRGPVVNESALVLALQQGWIRGAALDVFENEPLPAGSPLWQMKNVLISPHCADHTETWLDDAMALFLDNFRRFANGVELRNVVDKRAGY
jgi:phosphoglycerate dehydrogenase-like enzyme